MSLGSLPPVVKGRVTIFSEFREFIARGNVIDLAVGVILGAAFSEIVKTLVDQVVMPPIGLLTSGVDFTDKAWVLKPAMNGHVAIAVHYGVFINALIKFVIVAWVVFLLVKLVNVVRRREAAQPDKPPAAPGPQELLLTEIRDLLKKG